MKQPYPESKRENEQHRRRDNTREVGSPHEGDGRVTDAVSRLDENPGPHPGPGGAVAGAHTCEVAPHPENDEGCVEDGETHRQIAANEAARESRRREDIVKREEVFLERMCRLRSDES